MNPEFTECPYNQSHRVPKKRLQYHILRCRQNYVGPEMKPCPFNATHIINVNVYTEHVLSCPDARLIEGHRYGDNIESRGTLGCGRFHFSIPNDENWETSEVENVASAQPAQDSLNPTIKQNPTIKKTVDYSDDDDDDDNFSDKDVTEEPLQGYFYYKRNIAENESSISKAENPTEGLQKAAKHEEKSHKIAMNEEGGLEEDMAKLQLRKVGAGRGRLLQILQEATQQSRNTSR